MPPHGLDRARGSGDDELAQGAAGGQPDRAQRAAVDREDGGHGVGRGGQGDAPTARGREAGDGEIAADGDQHAAAGRLGHRLGAALDRDRRQRRRRVEVEGATAAAAGLQPVEGGQAVVDDAVGRSGGDAVGEAARRRRRLRRDVAPTPRGPRSDGAIQRGELLAQHLAGLTQLPRVGEHDPAGHVPHQEVGADRDRSGAGVQLELHGEPPVMGLVGPDQVL